MKYFIQVVWDVAKDIMAGLIIDFQNATRRFRKKPKQKEFDEREYYK